MASFIHTSLQGDDRGFRLLVLEPSTDRLAPLRCELNRASFDNKDLKYTALSYTWGDPLATTPILVNGVETQITLNLEAALRHIRQLSDVITLWVDALCINQEDLAEKNHQVEMMREIFSGAELVIAWLGSAGEDSDLAMGMFGKGLKALMEFKEIHYDSGEDGALGQPESWLISNEQGVTVSSECQEEDITTHVAQKVAMVGLQLPSTATMANCRDTCALPDLIDEHRDEHHVTEKPSISSISQIFRSHESASSQDDLLFHELMESKSFWELMREYRTAMTRLTTREIIAMRKLLKRSWWRRTWVVQEVLLAKKVTFKCGDAEVSGEHISSWRVESLLVLDTWGAAHDAIGPMWPAAALLESLRDPTEESGVMEYLYWYDMREATRPHDHIYGLLGIMPTKYRDLLGAPDYGCKAEDLFIKVATKLIMEDKLELLRAAGQSASPRTSSAKRMSLPSWVPDWTTQCLNIKPEDVFEVTAHFPKPGFSLSENLTELTVTGYKFDAVESIQSLPALAQGKMPLWQSDEFIRDDLKPPPLQELINVLLSGVWTDKENELERFHMFAAFLQELEEYRVSVSREGARGGHGDSSYLAGLLHWTGETRDGRTDVEILQKVYSAETARSFSTWYHTQSSADLQCSYMIYSFCRDGFLGNTGCSIFRTSNGSFGIMRAAVAMGDIICVVHGCLYPLALRRIDFSKYLLVGSVHVLPGLTRGGFKQAVEEGEVMTEIFTLV